MKAIVVRSGEEQPVLTWEEVEDVSCDADEVLVEVKATAVNRADLSQARGHYPPPPGASDILGLEAAGVIVQLGSDVRGWRIGDPVCALLPGGGYAERVAIPAGMLMRLPEHWSFHQGAAIPEVWLTAYVNLFLEAALESNERVVIHAGGSGVGTAAIQLARVAGATVFITAGTEEKLAKGRELGAALAVNYKKEDFLAQVQAFTSNEGVDLVLDPVGANYLMKNLQMLRSNGRLVQIGLLSGGKCEIDLGLILGKSLRIIGSRLRPRPMEEKIAITGGFTRRFWPLLVAGQLHPVIDRVFPIGRAQAAHDYVRSNQNIGKVILEVSGSNG